jgi:hypothetical protein
MKYTLVIVGKEDQELLDHGLPYEKFLLGPQNGSAPLELASVEPQLNPHCCIARLELVHIHAARDHLVLTNPNILEVTSEESNALYESIKDILSEISSVIYRPNTSPGKWFIEADKLRSLSTVHVEQAEGRNIDAWMPADTDTSGIARQWRKWQNEIQMIWFDHPVNQDRQSQGQLTINSLWISGLGCLADIRPHAAIATAERFHSTENDSHFGSSVNLRLIANHLGKQHITNISALDFNHSRSLLSLLHRESHQTEECWQIAIDALRSKKIPLLEIIDFPEGIARSRPITFEDLPKKSWAFWKKPLYPQLEDILG